MKKLIIGMAAAAVLATGASAAFEKTNTYPGFSDVAEGKWYAASVQTAYELGLMNGTGNAFDPDGSVTVAQAITMAARVHAMNNGLKDVPEQTADAPAAAAGDEIVFDFNEPLDGANFALNHATGDAADGILVMEPDAPNANGAFDLGIFLNNLEIDADTYKTLTFRMKREARENIQEKRNETVEIFFATDSNTTLGAPGNFKYAALTDVNMDEWFEFSVNISEAEGWTGTVTKMRFDPTNNNGKYYIDWIKLSAGAEEAPAEPKAAKWYDKYVDYAVANKIIAKNAFANYDAKATRAEVCGIFAKALPADGFKAINTIKGIPDVKKTDKYATELLMLYNAGVVLGSDEKGTFNPTSDIKRSEVAAIINRVALPEDRKTTTTITAVWEEEKKAEPATPAAPAEPAEKEIVPVPGKPEAPSPYDIEFDSAADLDIIKAREADSFEWKDGCAVLVPKNRGENRTPPYDPSFLYETGLELDASEYTKLQMRIKIDFADTVTNYGMEIYYLTADDASYSEAKSNHPNLLSASNMDEEGWYVVEIDLSAKESWAGKIVKMRIDPSNNNGTYTLDYIRFAK